MSKYHTYLIAFVIVVIGISLHYSTFNEFPQYKHCWAQSDRYALSVGFTNNGGDFFHPETYVFNKQFPSDFKTASETTITSVDFPIHDYIVSLVMRLFNTTSPWCFRLYNMLYSMVGLFFLYRLTLLFTTNILKALLVVIFAALSPTLLYYQAGFLPTIPSLANAIIALFFFFKFDKTKARKYYVYFIVFITLAALARLPFVMVLVAIICVELFYVFKKNKQNSLINQGEQQVTPRSIKLFKLWLILISLAIIVMYYLYNNYLRNTYGSLFLNYPMPATSFNELVEFTGAVYTRWFYKYFSHMHYILLGALGVLYVINRLIKKVQVTAFENKLVLFAFILFSGCLMYFVLMTFQFLDHDYYYLDSFYIPTLCLFVFLIVKLPEYKSAWLQKIIYTVLLGLSIPMWLYAKHIQETEKINLFYTEHTTTAQNFKNADLFLDSLGISKHARILVMGPDGPNNPFLLMKRKGYTVIYPDYDKIKNALTFPYDYVVLENSKLLTTIYNAYPAIVHQLKFVATNQYITVYSKQHLKEGGSVGSFLNLESHSLIYRQHIGFDTIPENCFNIDSLSNVCFSGKKAGFVSATMEYGFTHKIYDLKALTQQPSVLLVKSMLAYKDTLNELLLCVSITHNNKDIVFLANDLSKQLKTPLWTQQESIFEIPKIDDKDFELKVFIWNRGKNLVYYDDFDVIVYQ